MTEMRNESPPHLTLKYQNTDWDPKLDCWTLYRKAKAVEEPTGGICDSCGKFEKDLKRHMEAEHSGAKKCHRCPFEIMDQNKLNLHYLASPWKQVYAVFSL